MFCDLFCICFFSRNSFRNYGRIAKAYCLEILVDFGSLDVQDVAFVCCNRLSSQDYLPMFRNYKKSLHVRNFKGVVSENRYCHLKTDARLIPPFKPPNMNQSCTCFINLVCFISLLSLNGMSTSVLSTGSLRWSNFITLVIRKLHIFSFGTNYEINGLLYRHGSFIYTSFYAIVSHCMVFIQQRTRPTNIILCSISKSRFNCHWTQTIHQTHRGKYVVTMSLCVLRPNQIPIRVILELSVVLQNNNKKETLDQNLKHGEGSPSW